eukprot:9498042-Pyramimonas_sp.AAC.1
MPDGSKIEVRCFLAGGPRRSRAPCAAAAGRGSGKLVFLIPRTRTCLLYTADAADDTPCVDL